MQLLFTCWCTSEPSRGNQVTENGICHYCLSDISGYFLLANTTIVSESLLRTRELTLRLQCLSPLRLPPQNHRAPYDIEQSCHPGQPGSHYSGCIYPSMLRKSAFIRPFYRWPLGSLLGTDTISCAVIIKSQCCSNSSVSLYFD